MLPFIFYLIILHVLQVISPKPLLSVPLCIISLTSLWLSTPLPMPRPPYALFQVCAAFKPHPHILETDLLLLSAGQGTSILHNLFLFHWAQVMVQTRPIKSFPRTDKNKQTSLCGRKPRGRPCFSHVHWRKWEHCLQRKRESSAQAGEETKSEAAIWSWPSSSVTSFLRPLLCTPSLGFLTMIVL